MMSMPPDITQLHNLWRKHVLDDEVFNTLIEDQAIKRVCASSVYFVQWCQRFPEHSMQLWQAGFFEVNTALALSIKSIPVATDDEVFAAVLRQWRNAWMARWVYRHINDIGTLAEQMEELSAMADSSIVAARDACFKRLVQMHGEPIGNESGAKQQLSVIALGKLGGQELNLSSDVDLMFGYGESGQTNGEKPIDNQLFFLRLSQRLIQMLSEVTVDGFVFRVDMRLRPYGESGLLALPYAALARYYQEQGRDWERFALLKARSVCGDTAVNALITETLKQFVFRPYTDFSVKAALRDMNRLIKQEVIRLHKINDIKLGAGGIREIEFMVQAWQLIHGGFNTPLQQASLLKVLPVLADYGHVSVGDRDVLQTAYCFLRRLEHSVQAIHDQQTHALPTHADDQQRVALIMTGNSSGWPSVLAQFERTTHTVREYFQSYGYNELTVIKRDERYEQQWHGNQDAALHARLQQQGFDEQEVTCLQALTAKITPTADELTMDRYGALMHRLANELAVMNRDPSVVARVAAWVQAVARRTVYWVMLIEEPDLLKRLVVAANSSAWVMARFTENPMLVDSLLWLPTLSAEPDRKAMAAILQQQSLRVSDALEQQHTMLAYVKQSVHIAIVLAQVQSRLSLMEVSDHLSALAEIIIDYVLHLCWRMLTARHGFPLYQGEACTEARFAVIAYGKLGGLELSHNSDLDLVFLYQADRYAQTDGAVPVESRVLFTRLAQKMLHVLTTPGLLGSLYDVDIRLRPSGGKGLLVSTVEAFTTYQYEQAWTWEHQALVRARCVAGSPVLAAQFNNIRQQVLMQSRHRIHAAHEVPTMREKMYRHHRSQNKQALPERFSIKHDRGGVVDIEFMVQYQVLIHAQHYPALLAFTDNIRLLAALMDTKLIPAKAAEQLTQVYQRYRGWLHRCALLGLPSTVSATQAERERHIVTTWWRYWFGDGKQHKEQ